MRRINASQYPKKNFLSGSLFWFSPITLWLRDIACDHWKVLIICLLLFVLQWDCPSSHESKKCPLQLRSKYVWVRKAWNRETLLISCFIIKEADTRSSVLPTTMVFSRSIFLFNLFRLLWDLFWRLNELLKSNSGPRSYVTLLNMYHARISASERLWQQYQGYAWRTTANKYIWEHETNGGLTLSLTFKCLIKGDCKYFGWHNLYHRQHHAVSQQVSNMMQVRLAWCGFPAIVTETVNSSFLDISECFGTRKR